MLRSLPGIGFSLFYPAGPGGYFDYATNAIYEVRLALGFDIDGHQFAGPHDFQPGELTASHHSKNLLAYDFAVAGLQVKSTFAMVSEDAIGVQIEFAETAGKGRTVQLLARQTYAHGPSKWWGRDGLAGGFEEHDDILWIRPFAAGPVFAVAGSRPSSAQFLGAQPDQWLTSEASKSSIPSYYPAPLHGGLRYQVQVRPAAKESLSVVLSRGANKVDAIEHIRASMIALPNEIARKRAEDAVFWNSAPRLTGDWPAHWRRGWVYDFETLRMMVRRPIGCYKHPWDAMQIQAPRNVLAETSIDMLALSYADPETAKAVFLGQFQDAIAENIPCMREDGVMNMVAADGSECGTSISWCFPFFCAESIFRRTQDLAWLRQIYPHLCAFLQWTVKWRSDRDGFLVGKCSWETGMDASKRFLIEQPTGAELTEFVRLVELQAAAAHAGGFLARAARLLKDDRSVREWELVRDQFAARTQTLWKDGWFRDFDSRTKQIVTTVPPDPAQSAPAFCGVATEPQKQEMRRTLRKFYDDSRARGADPAQGWDDGLAWSSIVLPLIESIWATGDDALAADVVSMVAERIYTSMDRRTVDNEPGAHDKPAIGWPGVSCEIWGAHGAFGGEGYGWGAVMPMHIIRSLLGIRETDDPRQLEICPNLPASFVLPGRSYGIKSFRYGSIESLTLEYHVTDKGTVKVNGEWARGTKIGSVLDASGKLRPVERNGNKWEFEAVLRSRYMLQLLR